MEENIFLTDSKPLDLADYLQGTPSGRSNLGDEVPVLVYRFLEYSLRDALVQRYGKEEQIAVFRQAGRRAGELFAEKFLQLDQPFDAFVRELQARLREFKIGVLRIEDVNEATGRMILTVSEDADCSGLPVLGETVCNYDEGFIAGILSAYTGKPYTAVEIDCWATGDRVCRFRAEAGQEHFQ